MGGATGPAGSGEAVPAVHCGPGGAAANTAAAGRPNATSSRSGRRTGGAGYSYSLRMCSCCISSVCMLPFSLSLCYLAYDCMRPSRLSDMQMLDMLTSQLQPVPLTVLSDILAGVSTCPGALPPPAAATLAAVAERSLLAARQSGAGAGSEQRRQDGPALLEVVKSLSRLWARQQQQLQRQQGPRPVGRRGAPGQAEAANPYEVRSVLRFFRVKGSWATLGYSGS